MPCRARSRTSVREHVSTVMRAFGLLPTMKYIAIPWAKKSGWGKGPQRPRTIAPALQEKRCAANLRGSRSGRTAAWHVF
jgi:hypothetical protein